MQLQLASCTPVLNCQALADALTINHAATYIGLSKNGVGRGRQGACIAQEVFVAYKPGPAFLHQALADALKINTAFTRIDLDHNFIGHEGCEALLHGSRRSLQSTVSLVFRPSQML